MRRSSFCRISCLTVWIEPLAYSVASPDLGVKAGTGRRKTADESMTSAELEQHQNANTNANALRVPAVRSGRTPTHRHGAHAPTADSRSVALRC